MAGSALASIQTMHNGVGPLTILSALAVAAFLSGGCHATRGVGATPNLRPTAAPEVNPWHRDTLLGNEGFWARTLTFEPDYDGPVSATLIRRPLQRERECAVLYLHGYVDYFFQVHLADYYQFTLARGQIGKGCDFFALDLRKYGRSLPPQYRYPNFAKNLDEYFPEITQALAIIRAEGYPFVILNGHSTGALTAVRYLQDGAERALVDAAFLNSPFLDFNDRDISRFGEWIARLIGRVAPHYKRSSPVPRWYARSLLEPSRACTDCHGRWVFDTDLKPLDGFPAFLGWVRAISVAQGKARHGGIRQPILILHSARSNDGKDTVWHDEYRRADLVLDVEDMKREGKALGAHVTIRSIEGGVHDVVLSDPDAETRVLAEITVWLRTVPGAPVGL
jgi:alpha-beta hydrolase superfamily lysophospholipase